MVAARGLRSLRVGSSCARDRIHVSCIGWQLFLPLNHQGSPGWLVGFFRKILKPFAYFSIVFDYFAFLIFLSSLHIQEI